MIWARGHREDPHRNYRETCVLQYVFCCFGICVLEYVFCCFLIIFFCALEGAFFQTLPPEIWLGDRGVEEPTVASIPGSSARIGRISRELRLRASARFPGKPGNSILAVGWLTGVSFAGWPADCKARESPTTSEYRRPTWAST